MKTIFVFTVIIIVIFSSCKSDSTNLRPTVGDYVYIIIDTLPAIYDFDLGPDTVYSMPPSPLTLQPTLNNHFISGFVNYTGVIASCLNNGLPAMSFLLQYNNTVGAYPLGNFALQLSATRVITRTADPCNVTLTQVGPTGTGYLEGNFRVKCHYTGSTIPKTINCRFYVLRQ